MAGQEADDTLVPKIASLQGLWQYSQDILPSSYISFTSERHSAVKKHSRKCWSWRDGPYHGRSRKYYSYIFCSKQDNLWFAYTLMVSVKIPRTDQAHFYPLVRYPNLLQSSSCWACKQNDHNYIEISTRGLTRSMLHAYCMFQVHFNLLECLKMYVHFLQPDDWEDWEFHFIIISQFGDLNNSLFLEMGLYIQILYICNELNLFYLFQSLVKAGLCINQT